MKVEEYWEIVKQNEGCHKTKLSENAFLSRKNRSHMTCRKNFSTNVVKLKIRYQKDHLFRL